VGQDIDLLGRAVQAAYPIGDLLLLAMMTRLLRGGGTRGAPFWWISGSLAAFLIGDTAWVVIGNVDTFGAIVESITWVHRSIDMVFLVAFTLFGIAALHTDARGMVAVSKPRPARLGRVQLVLLTGASLIAPGHFKAFNDAYGHPTGDRLLKEAAAAWHGRMRKIDVLARFGGEEFIVLLPEADVAQARQILERALRATPQGQTFSAGVAVWDGEETSDELIERADEQQYAARSAGRNRIRGPLAEVS
jgi:diguanylate cyclase (GGDEF)-like protein